MIALQLNVVIAEDRTDNKWQQKAELLEALGIMDATQYEDNVTVATAAKACLSLMGNNYENESDALKAAFSSGILKEERRGWKGNVNYEIITEMILETLGYHPYVGNETYMPKIIYNDMLGLYEGVSVPDKLIELDYPTFVTVIYNAMFVNLMEQTAMGTYEVQGEKTVLTEYLDISYAEGIITQDFNTSLYSAGGVNGYAINGVSYNSDREYDVCAGYYAGAYIYADEDIVYMYATNKTKTVEINGKDIVDSKTTKSQITIETDDKEKTYKLSSGASYMYNGVYLGWVATDVVSLSMLCDNNMTYTLVSNDGDNTYECIYANAYTYMKVSMKNTEDGFFYDDWSGKKIQIMENDTVRYSDGIPAILDDIKKNDIVAVKTPIGLDISSRDKNLEFIVMTQYVSGHVEGTWTDGIVIGGVEYNINPSFAYSISAMMSLSGNFVLDMNGSIIDFSQGDNDTLSVTTEYVYVDKLRLIEDNSVAVKLLSQNYGYTTLYLTDRSVLIKGSTRVTDGFRQIYENRSEIEGKIVKIKYTDAGISRIIVPEDLAYGKVGTGDIDNFNRVPTRTFRRRGAILQDLYRVESGNAPVFIIPDTGDQEDYKTTTWGNYGSAEDVEMTIYGVDDNYKFSMAVVVTKSGYSDKTVPVGNNILIVSGTYNTLNSDDEVCLGIKGYIEGKLVNLVFDDPDARSITNGDDLDSLYIKRSLLATQLECGDIIQYKLTEDGTIDAFRVMLDKSSDSAFQRSLSGDSQKDGWDWYFASPFAVKDLIYMYGTLSSKGKEYATLTVGQTDGGDDNNRNVFSSSLSYIYKCSVTDKNIELTTLTDPDLKNGSAAFATIFWGTDRDLVVYY